MNKSKLFFGILFGIASLLAITFIAKKYIVISIKNENISEKQWIDDIKYLQLNLPHKHINLYFNESQQQFDSAINKLKNNIHYLSSDQVQVELMKIISTIGDSHTTILNFKSKNILPLKFYWFKDGIYIIGCDLEYKDLLGYRVYKINNYLISDYINNIAIFIPHENESLIKQKFSDYIEDSKILEYFHCEKNNTVPLILIDKDGNKLTENIQIKKNTDIKFVYLSDYLKSIPLYLQNSKDSFWSIYVKKNNLIYCKLNSCPYSISQKQLNNIEMIANEKKVKTIVIDIRNNDGGIYYDNNALFNTIKALKSKNFVRNINVIIGRQTFSSGMLYALEFKNKLNAKLYGEPTGGCPNSFGETNNMVLPNSKLCVQYSTKYFMSDIKDNTLNPDCKVELTMKDYINGDDPVLQSVINDNK